MDDFLLEVFQDQIQFQCHAAALAADSLNEAVRARDFMATFVAVQNLLNAAANIAKALWGQSGRYAQQRKPLRDSLQVADDSPLKEVAMRNHYEHFDERLDYWWANSERHNRVDFGLLYPGAIIGIDETDMFRQLDPSTGELRFWGDRFNLKDLGEEIQRLIPVVDAVTDPTVRHEKKVAKRKKEREQQQDQP